MLRRAHALALSLAMGASLVAFSACAGPIATYPAASALGGTEGIIGTQAGATVQITPQQITTYSGLQSGGQLSISANTVLGATQAGKNLLLTNAITLTFPSTVATYSLNNIGASVVTLTFPTGTDFRTSLYPGEQVILAGDG